jgi:hypothetical protein
MKRMYYSLAVARPKNEWLFGHTYQYKIAYDVGEQVQYVGGISGLVA